MFCPQCGAEAVPGARYCTGCGAKLPSELAHSNEQLETVPGPPPAGTAGALAEQVAMEPADAPKDQQSEPAVIPFPSRSLEQVSQRPAPLETRERKPQDQTEADETRARPASRSLATGAVRWLAALSVALLLALGIGTALALTEVSRRDQLIRDHERQAAALTEANLAYQDQVSALVGERDRLAQERTALTKERDALVAERDALNATIDDLESTVAEYQKQVADLNARLGEQGRQLTQAREEASRQQTRAEEAEAFGVIMSQVVALDEEIHEEFGRFFLAVLEMQDAYYQGNSLAFDNAFYRVEQSKARLDELFAERDRLLAQLGY